MRHEGFNVGRFIRGGAFVAALLMPFAAHAQTADTRSYIERQGFNQYDASGTGQGNQVTEGLYANGFRMSLRFNEAPSHPENGWVMSQSSGAHILRDANEDSFSGGGFDSLVNTVEAGRVEMGGFRLTVRRRERLEQNPTSLGNKNRGTEVLLGPVIRW